MCEREQTRDEPVVLDIEGLAAGGSGVGRAGGRVWFVPGTVPGDRVEADVVRARPRFVHGRVVRLLEPSPDRREAPCPYQSDCGGCPWMPLPEEAQRGWKRRLVLDALERLGGFTDPAVEPTVEVAAPLRYRNRIELALALDPEGRPAVGLFGSGPGPGPEVVDVERCLLEHEEADRVLTVIRAVLLDPARRVVDSLVRGRPRRLVIRRSSATGRILVGLWETPEPFPLAQELADTLLRERVANGVVRLRGRAGQRGGLRSVRLAGHQVLEEDLAGTRYRLPVTSFVQVSAEGAETLVRLVCEAAGDVDGANVLDLYGGVGIHALALSRAGAAAAIVCDADRDAVACGRAAVRAIDGPIDVRFVHASVNRFLEGHEGRVDVVVANPPRRGIGPGVVDRIVKTRPRRVVLVSCDPATLARDLRAFAAAGYRVRRLVPVDLFPQTAHVEVVASLVR